MPGSQTILVLSDIHYASALEKERPGYERRAVANPLLLLLVTAFRHFIWLRDPFAHNQLLDLVLDRSAQPDVVIANGDYSCDSAFIGISDDAAYRSAEECLAKLRGRFREKFHATIGDHELGKMSLFGGCGGMRLASWHRCLDDLGLKPFWQLRMGRYILMGVASSLLALPVYEPETLVEERETWHKLRDAHMREIRAAFGALRTHERVLLFCHDPTGLPFLWRDQLIRSKLPQVERTFIGHLHSELLLWKSRVLAGMPTIRFLGNSVRRMSAALAEAKHWRPFNVRLCPSLAGSELLKDGGYYIVELDPQASQPVRFHLQKVRRR